MSITLPAQLDEPTIHRGIAVVPLFPRRDPGAAYTTLDPALRRGLRITETSAAGSVPELVVQNPLAEWVLLYDGEELVGAKQNRILNLTVLVAAESVTPIPVSCVEAGRWHRRSQSFAAARHTAGPQLRRRKARALGADALARGRGQHEVWQAVAEQADRRGVASPTAAHADMFTQHEPALAELREAFPARPGQCGVMLVLPDGRVCLDYLSRPDAYAEHHGKLLDGYLMDALDQLDRPAAGIEPANRLLYRLSLVPLTRRPSAGLGIDLRAQTKTVAATGLEHEGELLQLSAYA
jgi:hypothetical protein